MALEYGISDSYIIVNGEEDNISCDYCSRPAHVLNGFGEFLCEYCAEGAE